MATKVTKFTYGKYNKFQQDGKNCAIMDERGRLHKIYGTITVGGEERLITAGTVMSDGKEYFISDCISKSTGKNDSNIQYYLIVGDVWQKGDILVRNNCSFPMFVVYWSIGKDNMMHSRLDVDEYNGCHSHLGHFDADKTDYHLASPEEEKIFDSLLDKHGLVYNREKKEVYRTHHILEPKETIYRVNFKGTKPYCEELTNNTEEVQRIPAGGWHYDKNTVKYKIEQINKTLK